MVGVAVKMTKSANPFLESDDIINIYKNAEKIKGKFAVSLGNLRINSNKLKYVNYVLLLFKDKGVDGRKGLLCKLDNFSIEKVTHTPDTMKEYLTELSTCSKVWFLLSDSKVVGDEYFSKCKLVNEDMFLSEKLHTGYKGSGGRYSFIYFKQVD